MTLNRVISLILILSAAVLLFAAASCGDTPEDEPGTDSQSLLADTIITCGDTLYGALYSIPQTAPLFDDIDGEGRLTGLSHRYIHDTLSDEERSEIRERLHHGVEEGHISADYISQTAAWCEAWLTFEKLSKAASQEEIIAAIEQSGFFSELFKTYYTAPHQQDDTLSPVDRAATLPSAMSIGLINDWITILSEMPKEESGNAVQQVRERLKADREQEKHH